jgi:hypothetical protein
MMMQVSQGLQKSRLMLQGLSFTLTLTLTLTLFLFQQHSCCRVYCNVKYHGLVLSSTQTAQNVTVARVHVAVALNSFTHTVIYQLENQIKAPVTVRKPDAERKSVGSLILWIFE